MNDAKGNKENGYSALYNGFFASLESLSKGYSGRSLSLRMMPFVNIQGLGWNALEYSLRKEK